MSDISVALCCVALLGVCAVIMTATVVLTSLDLRRVLRQMNRLVPRADEALRESTRAMTHLRRLLARTEHVSKRVEAVAVQACDTIADAIRQFAILKAQAEKSLGKWIGTNGHGAGAESRPHHRSGR